MPIYNVEETITAIATPPGIGGVSIIRVSGLQALSIVSRSLKKDLTKAQSHTAFTAYFLDGDTAIDHVMLLPMKAPCSFTGEDVVEIHCHGSPIICQQILRVLCANGARLAQAGEFTYRAYTNKKIDLVEAQAVADVIHAESEASLRAAQTQLQGFLTQKIKGFQEGVVNVLSEIEAWVDYPEESLEFLSHHDLLTEAQHHLKAMKALSATFHEGKKRKEGLSLCLVGAPNVGKSSLLNALLREERAIVSNISGTTRDTIEETMVIEGQHFHLIDTAGIREGSDAIEQLGIAKTHHARKDADIEIIVLDASRDLTNEEKNLFFPLKKHSLLVWNKKDLYTKSLPKVDHPNVVEVSAKFQTGIDQLKKQLLMMAWQGPPPPISECVITCERHFTILNQAISFFEHALNQINEEVSPEFISEDLRSCLYKLGEIIGMDITEDVLSSMFSKFCVGK